MRLERSRKGKTPIDIVITEQQPGLKRIRLTVGEDGAGKKNSDLDFAETEALIIVLQYHLAKAKGEI